MKAAPGSLKSNMPAAKSAVPLALVCGDVVIWNMDPLSTYARAEKVYIDGDLFFDSSLPGFGTTHFSGVMHGSGFGAGDDDDDIEGGN